MDAKQAILAGITDRYEVMVEQLIEWSHINSGSSHLAGLKNMLEAVKEGFRPLGAKMTEVPLAGRTVVNEQGELEELPHGNALHLVMRPEAPRRIFLGGHLDTVFAEDHPFQRTSMLDGNTLQGPGVADLKGGLVVMLNALLAFEQCPWAENIGWEVFLNPDEEIGSIGSAPHLEDCARRCQYGLIYEPSPDDGCFINQRKGSGNFTLVSRGTPAHVGREFSKGKNAIYPLARAISAFEGLIDVEAGKTLNVGKLEGGGPVNVVPDLAICRLNLRADREDDLLGMVEAMKARIQEINGEGNHDLTLHGEVTRPPKPFDEGAERLFSAVRTCQEEMGLRSEWKSSGGVCDGNITASAGLPTIDTLGVRGGGLHTPQEFMRLDSLVERSQLSAMLLMAIAEGSLLEN